MSFIAKIAKPIIAALSLSLVVINQGYAQDRPVLRDFSGTGPGYLFMTPDNGVIPPTLRDLVLSADIIIEGTYGDFLRDFTFFGYDQSGNDKPAREAEPGIPTPRGIPITEYLIQPTNVLKGADLIADPLILRVSATPGSSEMTAWKENREGSHLFFFALNPDKKTVGLNGSIYDMKEIGNTYAFVSNGLRRTALGSHDKLAFLRELKSIVNDEGQ